jgi:hypothetical protein
MTFTDLPFSVLLETGLRGAHPRPDQRLERRTANYERAAEEDSAGAPPPREGDFQGAQRLRGGRHERRHGRDRRERDGDKSGRRGQDADVHLEQHLLLARFRREGSLQGVGRRRSRFCGTCRCLHFTLFSYKLFLRF